MKEFKTIDSTIAVLNIDNIDTDQIIGSDHLKITDKNGLGQHLFSDWRYFENGEDNPRFVLNQNETRDSKVLVGGDNFGCGSSREHAPWALLDYGIEVVISSSIADIFFNNAIKNGLLPIQVSKRQHQFLLSKNAQAVSVDLVAQEIRCDGETIAFPMEAFARYCLLNGVEQLDFLIGNLAKIKSYEEQQQKEYA